MIQLKADECRNDSEINEVYCLNCVILTLNLFSPAEAILNNTLQMQFQV